MVKPQSGFSTPPIKEEKYFVRFVLTILWCHFCDLLQLRRYNTAVDVLLLPFYNNIEID